MMTKNPAMEDLAMDAHSQWTGLDAGRLERITSFLETNYIAPGKITGCQLTIARHGHVAYARNFGLMDKARGAPTADDTIYRIYSMSKPITSVALMTLFEQGRFQLSDPVSRFVPAWRDQRVWVSGQGETMTTEPTRRPITMAHLLSHTAGLTYGGTLPGVGAQHPVDAIYREKRIRTFDSTDGMSDFLAKVASAPLAYHPGERWMYSLATDVCGALVEAISGQTFEDYLREIIFEPLGMTDTAFSVPQAKLSRFSANYARTPDKSLKLVDDPQTSNYLRADLFQSGGGGLVGTSSDYLRFCEMLRRGGALDGARVLSPRTLDLMRLNQLPGGRHLSDVAIHGFTETAHDGVAFGLGFASTADQAVAGSPSVGEMYWGGAASTIFWVDPNEDLCVVFMTQLMPSSIFNFRGQLKNLVYAAITD